MQGHDQRTELLLLQVLNFVDAQGDGPLAIRRSLAHRLQKFGEIGLEVAAVGQSRLRIDGQLQLQVAQPGLGLQPQAAEKAAQRPQRPARLFAHIFLEVEGVENVPESGQKQLRKRFSLVRLDEGRLVAGFLGKHVYPVEHHRLAHAAQANQDDAFGVESIAQAVQGDPGMIEDRHAASHLRRR